MKVVVERNIWRPYQVSEKVMLVEKYNTNNNSHWHEVKRDAQDGIACGLREIDRNTQWRKPLALGISFL